MRYEDPTLTPGSVDCALKQHATSARRLVLNSHTQIRWPTLVDIVDRPGADEKQLNGLFGLPIRGMSDVGVRDSQFKKWRWRFRLGEHALCSEEKRFVERAEKMQGNLDKFWRDYAKASARFEKREARASAADKAREGKDLDWQSESECSGETLCEKSELCTPRFVGPEMC